MVGTKIDVGRFLLNLFSSSELAIMYFLIASGFLLQNTYSLFLFLAMVLKTVLLYYPKKLTQHSKIGKRPDGAFDCNMFSCGGKPNTGGLISGHMVNITMLATVAGLSLDDAQSIRPQNIIAISAIIITTAAARYLTKCHSILQILIGSLVGVLFGYGLFLLQKPLMKFKIFNEDQKELLKYLQINT
jgi:hypothetical protein